MRSQRPQGIGLSLRETLPIERLRSVAQALDRDKGVTLWLPEFALRESVGQLAYLAACTEQLGLANGVASMAARTPVASALAAATLEDLSSGRAVLGLGVSHPTMSAGWHGQTHESALGWAAEYLDVVRQVLDGEETDLGGRELRSHGFRLLDGARPDVPIILAALGPKMLELGARRADGVLLNWTTPEYARDSVERVGAAAAAAGRPTPAVGAYVRIATGPDATEQARAHADFYTQLPAYRRSLLRMGFTDGDSLSADAAEALILQGDAEQIVDHVQAWLAAGIDPLVLYPIGDGPAVEQSIELGVEVVHRLAGQRA